MNRDGEQTVKREIEQVLDADELAEHDELQRSLLQIATCKNRWFEAQDVIYREGEPARNLFVILRGMVKLIVHLPNGKARIVRLHVAGDWIALESLRSDNSYEHTAVAVSGVEVMQFYASNLCTLEQDDCDLYAAILKRGYEHLEKADKWIAEFSTGSVKARLAHLIDFLGELEPGGESNVVSLLTVSETAAVLGVTPESVSRFLAEFKREGVLIRLDEENNWLYRIDKSRLDEVKQD